MKNILIISPVPTHPTNSGNRARILALAETIRSIGHNVFFLHTTWRDGDVEQMKDYWEDHLFVHNYSSPKNKLRKVLKRIYEKLNKNQRFQITIDEIYDFSLDAYINLIKDKYNFDVVLVEYVFFSKALHNFSGDTKKVIDTHDVFTDRYKIYLKNGKYPTWISMNKKNEMQGLNRADYIIAIQNKEAEYFSTICSSKIITVGHNINITARDPGKEIVNRMLFVASNNSINQHAAQFMIEKVMPVIVEMMPGVELVIAGSICRSLHDNRNIKLLGSVDDLTELYRTAAVVVNPVFIGTGLKIKTIEALAYCKPLVTTSVGSEGLEKYRGRAYLCADTPLEFAEAVYKYLSNQVDKDKVSESCKEIIEYYNQQNINSLNVILD